MKGGGGSQKPFAVIRATADIRNVVTEAGHE
jgi:hypothetical protein